MTLQRRSAETLTRVRLASNDAMEGKKQLEAFHGRERISTSTIITPPLLNLMPVSEFKITDSALIYVDDNLTLHVSRDNVQKIWSGDKINLAVLLKKVTGTTISPIRIDKISGTVEEKPKPAPLVQNIREWTDTFLIFSAIFKIYMYECKRKRQHTCTGRLAQYVERRTREHNVSGLYRL